MHAAHRPGTEQKLLVDYWYAHPMGHAIEALRYCLGYQAADPGLSVNLLLNAATPVELAQYVDFLEHTYAVPYRNFTAPDGDPVAALQGVPREWDWIVDNHRAFDPGHDSFKGFRAFFDAAETYLAAPQGHGVVGSEPPAYVPHHQLRFELPEDARRSTHARLAGRTAVSVVLAGSSAERATYPSSSSWQLILGALADRFPEAVFCLIGKSTQTDTLSISRIANTELARIAKVVPSLDCFDLPLAEQLAVVEAAALHLSPHTGFSFAASAVGTPWLAISGGRWHEFFFNGVPFHSVLPDPKRYPPFAWGGPLPTTDDVDGEGQRIEAMTRKRIADDLPEIVDAAARLIAKQVVYETELAEYFPRLLRAYRGDRTRVFSFDNIHEAYV